MNLEDISDWMDKNRYKAGALMLIALFLFTITPFPNNPLYGGGWEVQTSIHSVSHSGTDYGTPFGTYPDTVEYWGSSSVRYDVDAWATGHADTQIDITNPAHLKYDQLTQQWVPAADDEVFYEYSRTIIYIGEDGEEVTEVYFWDHHVYSFWITVIADPDVYHAGAASTCETKNDPWNFAGQGILSSINAKVKFAIVPWNIGPDSFLFTNEDGSTSLYTAMRNTFWSGVMSATVMDSFAGLVQTARLSQAGMNTAGWEDAIYPHGSGFVASATMSGALNMYYVENPDAVVQQWDDNYAQNNPDAIQGVPTEVLIEFYGELLPGMDWPAGGSITVSAVMYQYRARVDVLVTGGYQLASGQQPEDPIPPWILNIGADIIGRFMSLFSFDGLIMIAFVIIVVYVAYRIVKWMTGG